MIYTPKIIKQLTFNYEEFNIDLKLKCNLLILVGDSGIGKSYLYQALATQADFQKEIYPINFQTKGNLVDIIKNNQGMLFVIDNADLLLDDDIKKYIAFDYDNQYLIIGRDISNLLTVKQNIVHLKIDNNNVKFSYYE